MLGTCAEPIYEYINKSHNLSLWYVPLKKSPSPYIGKYPSVYSTVQYKQKFCYVELTKIKYQYFNTALGCPYKEATLQIKYDKDYYKAIF